MGIAILVDGYNVIYSSSELKRLLEKNRYQAQEKLVNLMSSYCSLEGREGYVVFDAYRGHCLKSEEEIGSNLKIILTGTGETADSYIEKFVSQKKAYYDYIYVVTSDYSQRRTADDKKVLFLSPQNFLKEIEAYQKVLRETYFSSPSKACLRVSDYLKSEVKERLDRIREGLS